MTIDTTISIGSIIQIGEMLVVGIAFVFAMRGAVDKLAERLAGMSDRVGSIDERVGGVEAELKKVSDILVSNARIEEKVTAANLRITALEAREPRYQTKL